MFKYERDGDKVNVYGRESGTLLFVIHNPDEKNPSIDIQTPGGILDCDRIRWLLDDVHASVHRR